MSNPSTVMDLPDLIYVERDPETSEQRWYSTKGMGVEYVRVPASDVVLGLELCEAQAILNALRESGVLDQPMVFQHVATLKEKVERAIRVFGHNPL